MKKKRIKWNPQKYISLQSTMETIFLNLEESRLAKPFARNVVSQAETDRQEATRGQFPSMQLRYSNRRLERVWRKKEKERERLEIEWSTCCAITQSHGSLHRPRNRNRLCWCNKSSVWKIRGSNGFENMLNHGKESCAYTCISWKMLI